MNVQPKLTPTFKDQVEDGSIPLETYSGPSLTFSTPIQEVPVAEPVPLKIALLGTAPSSRGLAPFGDPTWKIWSCSPGNAHGQIPRVDLWFEIHANLLWPENKHYGEPYLKWLNEQTFPIYMQDNSLVARAAPYPLQKMVEEFGPYFFTSSFSWMAAMAISSGATEIGWYGIDMASRDEYILQRAGGHYFIQIAKQRGIKVVIPPESDLQQHPPFYGFSDSTTFGRKLASRRAEINGRLSQMTKERDRLIQNITYLQGANEDLDYIQSIWGSAQS